MFTNICNFNILDLGATNKMCNSGKFHSSQQNPNDKEK